VTAAATGASVLVVEDDPQVRGLIRLLVEGCGDRCWVAGDLATARRILANEEVQLVLCDVQLRGESGLDLVRWLQVDRPAVAVVMVTAVDDARFAESALGLGAYGYIIKPFRTNDVLIAIQKASSLPSAPKGALGHQDYNERSGSAIRRWDGGGGSDRPARKTLSSRRPGSSSRRCVSSCAVERQSMIWLSGCV
jgi:DNA-binding NtrC family response regulator